MHARIQRGGGGGSGPPWNLKKKKNLKKKGNFGIFAGLDPPPPPLVCDQKILFSLDPSGSAHEMFSPHSVLFLFSQMHHDEMGVRSDSLTV